MKTPVIYDTIQNGDREERVVNQEATLAAREKQKLIKERFRSWVFADPDRTERLVRLYNDTYNNLRPAAVRRLAPRLPRHEPGRSRCSPHQNDAVWRGMSSGNTLLAHAVGAGKTFTMAATGMKMKQAGLIKKPMYVVPNHMLEQFAREFMQLYPNARLLVAAKEDLTRDRRKLLTAKIASGEWDGIIVTHSSFERIGMSRDYQEKFLREQIDEYDAVAARARRRQAAPTATSSRPSRSRRPRREERLKDLLAEDKKDDGLVFDELGVDHVFIDEAHYFKNLETPTKMERVAGIQTGGSERAFDLYMKARYLDEQHPGHGVTFATGTPISNTMVEMYTMQRFLDPEGLKSRGIEHFDAWAATFGEVVDTMEISPDGATLAAPQPLRPLHQPARTPADVPGLRRRADGRDARPAPARSWKAASRIVVACPMSEEQHALQQELVARYDRLRSQKVDPAGGQRPGHHHRRPQARPRRPDAVGRRPRISPARRSTPWSRTSPPSGRRPTPTRGTQMIFCDMGVNPTPWGYSRLRRDHREAGRPRHPARADRRHRRRRFRRQEAGPVREGPQRLGARADRQHAEDGHRHQRPETAGRPASPRRPVEAGRGRAARRPHPAAGQRERGSGDLPLRHRRIVRRLYVAGPGNQGPVHLPGHDRRQRRPPGRGHRRPGALLRRGQGDRLGQPGGADAGRGRRRTAAAGHPEEEPRRRAVPRPPQPRASCPRPSPGCRKRLAEPHGRPGNAATPMPTTRITIGSRSVPPRGRVMAHSAHGWTPCRKRSANASAYPARRLSRPALRPRAASAIRRRACTSKEPITRHAHALPRPPRPAGRAQRPGPPGRRLRRPNATRVRQDLAIAEAQLRDYQARLGTPFPHDAYLAELTGLRDQLKAGLSGAARSRAAKPAERCRTGRADQGPEGRPHHRGRARSGPANAASSAEEPVTARIRRREQEAEGQWQRRVSEREEAGTNVQKRLAALHHLDAPGSRPKSSSARAASCVRETRIRKSRSTATSPKAPSTLSCGRPWKPRPFHLQVMTGDNAARRAEDIGGQELSYAEVKAIASGNPAVLTLAEADAELQRLNLLKRNHADEQYSPAARARPARDHRSVVATPV